MDAHSILPYAPSRWRHNGSTGAPLLSTRLFICTANLAETPACGVITSGVTETIIIQPYNPKCVTDLFRAWAQRYLAVWGAHSLSSTPTEILRAMVPDYATFSVWSTAAAYDLIMPLAKSDLERKGKPAFT